MLRVAFDQDGAVSTARPSVRPIERPSVSRLAGLALAFSLLLAACGVTDESADPAPAETPGSEAGRPTLDELAALLPDADDLGDDYEVSSSHDDPDEGDDDDPLDLVSALSEACGPTVSDWMEAGGDSGDDAQGVYRHFSTDRDQTVQVDIGFVGRDVSDEQIAELIEAMQNCEEVSLDIDEGTLEVQVSAAEETAIGDQAVRMFVDMTLHLDGLPRPITVSMEGITYARGPVNVMVMVGDGIDAQGLRAVAGDVHLVDVLATDIDADVNDLLD